jgi:hypothetical protein
LDRTFAGTLQLAGGGMIELALCRSVKMPRNRVSFRFGRSYSRAAGGPTLSLLLSQADFFVDLAT